MFTNIQNGRGENSKGLGKIFIGKEIIQGHHFLVSLKSICEFLWLRKLATQMNSVSTENETDESAMKSVLSGRTNMVISFDHVHFRHFLYSKINIIPENNLKIIEIHIFTKYWLFVINKVKNIFTLKRYFHTRKSAELIWYLNHESIRICYWFSSITLKYFV